MVSFPKIFRKKKKGDWYPGKILKKTIYPQVVGKGKGGVTGEWEGSPLAKVPVSKGTQEARKTVEDLKAERAAGTPKTEGITHLRTEKTWVRGSGDLPPRYVYRVAVVENDGNVRSEQLLEADEFKNLQQSRKGEFVGNDEGGWFFDKVEEAEEQRKSDIQSLVLEKEAAMTPAQPQTLFETPEPSTWYESVWSNVSFSGLKDPLTFIRPQIRRNVGTIDVAAKKMETYVKEKLEKQVREGATNRVQAMSDLQDMNIIVHEMISQVRAERDTPIVGSAYEPIDDTLVKLKVLLGYIADTNSRLIAMPSDIINQSKFGAMGTFEGISPNAQSFPRRPTL